MSLQENLKMFYLGLSNNTPYMYKNAMIDNIPSFVIDPKGDLTNLALSFSKLKADEFAPFIDENEMQTLGISCKNLAEQKAQIWQNGLQIHTKAKSESNS